MSGPSGAPPVNPNLTPADLEMLHSAADTYFSSVTTNVPATPFDINTLQPIVLGDGTILTSGEDLPK